MYTWKLTKNLTDPIDPEWDELAHSALGNTVHPDRKKGFLLSREALKKSLQEQGFEVSIKDLKVNNFHQLPTLPQLTISLTHTKDCGAALVGNRKDFHSLGIDIENEARIVKDSIRDRIAHKEDEPLRNIELWCLKEACFKALMNTGKFEHPVEFGSIQIGDGKWFHSPSALEGEWKLENIKPFVVALAFLRN